MVSRNILDATYIGFSNIRIFVQRRTNKMGLFKKSKEDSDVNVITKEIFDERVDVLRRSQTLHFDQPSLDILYETIKNCRLDDFNASIDAVMTSYDSVTNTLKKEMLHRKNSRKFWNFDTSAGWDKFQKLGFLVLVCFLAGGSVGMWYSEREIDKQLGKSFVFNKSKLYHVIPAKVNDEPSKDSESQTTAQK